MAKRKKSKGRRRHRVGAASMLNPKSPVVKIAAVAAGYFLGEKVNSALMSVLPASLLTTTTTPATATTPAVTAPSAVAKAIPYAELGIGGLLLLKGKSHLLKTAAGGILAGAGLKSVLQTLGVVKGYQAVPIINGTRMAGYQKTPVIGKVPAQLQGTQTPAQLQGYRVNGYVSPGSGAVMGSLYSNGSGLSQHDSSGYMTN